MKRTLLCLLLILSAATPALFAQEPAQIIPADVFYLMPQMGSGTLLYRDKSPVRGTFNICAVDNTVRFLDISGQELALEEDPSLASVVIEDVPFLLRDKQFYRLEKVSDDVFVAVNRHVTLIGDSIMSSYGMESQTTAVQMVSAVESNGRIFTFNEAKGQPYLLDESAYLYFKGRLLNPNKNNCIKCFPEKKADIEAWFKEHKKMDSSNIESVLSIVKQWAQ